MVSHWTSALTSASRCVRTRWLALRGPATHTLDQRTRKSAGNGSLMRLAPVPLYYAADAREAIARSAESSRTTHATREAVDACRYYGGLLA